MRDADYDVVHHIAKAELRGEPEDSADGEDFAPAAFHSSRKNERREEEEDDVHRQNVQQRRAVKEQDRSDDGDDWMCDIEVEQIVNGCSVSCDCVGCGDGEG